MIIAGTSSRRRATEDKLLDALETVLVRDGLRQLTVSSVVGEAGVAKPLLYRYFGDLPGLLSAWAERRAAPDSQRPDTAWFPPIDDQEFAVMLADQLVESAQVLRKQPIMLEMLAEELTAHSEFSATFAKVRKRQSRSFVRKMLNDRRYIKPHIRGRIIILYAAINYLAMRARRSPNFMGLRLNTEKGWSEAMGMIRAIVLQ